MTLFADGVTVGVHPPNFRLLLFGVPTVIFTFNKYGLLVIVEDVIGSFFRRVEYARLGCRRLVNRVLILFETKQNVHMNEMIFKTLCSNLNFHLFDYYNLLHQ